VNLGHGQAEERRGFREGADLEGRGGRLEAPVPTPGKAADPPAIAPIAVTVPR
jgi:hypothetical protein